MIRQLTKKDNGMLMEYVKREKSFNLFIIGDIENFGYDNEFQKLWGDFDGQGRLRGVLLKYFESYVVYSDGEYDIDGFAGIIKANADLRVISGKSGAAKGLIGRIDGLAEKETYFAELEGLSDIETRDDIEILEAAVEDLGEIVRLRDTIEEFADMGSNMESLRKSLETGSGRFYFARAEGKIVSCAGTTAENSESAMVVGVCTHRDYRGRGLATAIVKRLCADILAEGRTLCLFYDNPEAGEIYKRLGFRDIGKWMMLVKH